MPHRDPGGHPDDHKTPRDRQRRDPVRCEASRQLVGLADLVSQGLIERTECERNRVEFRLK